MIVCNTLLKKKESTENKMHLLKICREKWELTTKWETEFAKSDHLLSSRLGTEINRNEQQDFLMYNMVSDWFISKKRKYGLVGGGNSVLSKSTTTQVRETSPLQTALSWGTRVQWRYSLTDVQWRKPTCHNTSATFMVVNRWSLQKCKVGSLMGCLGVLLAQGQQRLERSPERLPDW